MSKQETNQKIAASKGWLDVIPLAKGLYEESIEEYRNVSITDDALPVKRFVKSVLELQ